MCSGRKARSKNGRVRSIDFIFLENWNLSIKKGERVRIIGLNGTGKTSCRCIAGVYQPTTGRVLVNGKIRAVFDASVGMLPELTGRENAELLFKFLYPEETLKSILLEESLQFSELGAFLESPYKDYSNGMKTRLFLSIISAKPADILVLDEVFQGADHLFSEKVRNRILNIISQSGIVLFVSHTEVSVRKVCNRVLILKEGTVVYDGAVEEGLRIYSGSPPVATVRETELETIAKEKSRLEQKVNSLNDFITDLERRTKGEEQGISERTHREQLEAVHRKFFEVDQTKLPDIVPQYNKHDACIKYDEIKEYFCNNSFLEKAGQRLGFSVSTDAWEQIPGQFVESKEITVNQRKFQGTLHRCASYRLREEVKKGANAQATRIEQEVFITAPGPARFSEKSPFSIEFVVQVISDKYELQLSLDRQCYMMHEAGIETDVEVLYNLCRSVAQLVQPLNAQIKAEILSSSSVSLDSIPWRILKSGHFGRVSVLANDKGVYFQFDEDPGAGIADLTRDITGTVVCDSSPSYEPIRNKPGVKVQHCWMELRRKFHTRSIYYDEESRQGIGFIDRILGIHPEMRGGDSTLILGEFDHWCEAQSGKLPETGGMHEVLEFYFKNRPFLTNFRTDDSVPTTAEAAEKALWLMVFGRKNQISSRTQEGAKTMTAISSLAQTCRLKRSVISGLPENWRLVIWSLHPGTVKCSPTSCHLVESRPTSQFLGNPTAISRSVTFTGESFSAMKLNILFVSPDATGITTHPFAMPLKNKKPLERFVITFTIPARNKQSFVRTTTAVAESPTCNENLKCGRGFDRSKIGKVISVITNARIPTIEAITPNLFQTFNRLYL